MEGWTLFAVVVSLMAYDIARRALAETEMIGLPLEEVRARREAYRRRRKRLLIVLVVILAAVGGSMAFMMSRSGGP